MMSYISSSPASLVSQPNSVVESENTSSDEIFPPALQDQVSQKKDRDLHEITKHLFDENIVAKLWRTGLSVYPTNEPSNAAPREDLVPRPNHFPEFVPQDGPDAGHYVLREADFWTCGFFPGSLYELLLRSKRYPQAIFPGLPLSPEIFRKQLRKMCKSWSEPLHDMASRTDTHDIGFIVMPALRLDWETNGSQKSLDSIIQAAHSLATRYIPSAGVIRSWDCVIKKDIVITDMDTNCICIIDSLCNLDLLFYASAHTGDANLAEIAKTHARSLMTSHLRPELLTTAAKGGYKGRLFSTCHVANIDPLTGDIKRRFTAQGYDHNSTWARGQSWAILGYAQTYIWTKDRSFLEAACGVAEYFLCRMEHFRPSNHKNTAQTYTTPPWDFDAPEDPISGKVLRDSSSAFIAANGMLALSQALNADRNVALASRFLDAAISLVRGTLDFSLAQEKAKFEVDVSSGALSVVDIADGHRFDGIIKHGTANNNANARRQYCNHGLVYGDYYLVQFGNRLLQTGLV